MYNTQKLKLIKQHLFQTVLNRPFLFKILFCLLYQISEHIIVQITFIIILVMSLLSLSRNKTNSHILNNISLFIKLLYKNNVKIHKDIY